MRIRKRKVPWPISLLCPVPITDPCFFGQSPVTVQEKHDANLNSPQPSDHPTSSKDTASDLRCSILQVGDTTTTPVVEQPQHLLCLGFSGGERKHEINDARRRGFPSSTRMGAPLEDDNREERVIPTKKRRSNMLDVETASNTTTVGPTSDVKGEEERKDKNALGGKKRGNTIMEGSRCSRVNGRGWRCCQPTLVGYSLCEHHLGKGRLRSVITVRGRPSPVKKATVDDQRSPVLARNKTEEGNRMVTMNTVGKKAKLGVVKARSLSSLLGQTNTNNVPNNAHHIQLGVAHHVINEENDNQNGERKERP